MIEHERALLGALTMALLLTGCGKGTEETLEARRDALAGAERIAFTAALRCDLDTEEFCCTVKAEQTPEELRLTVTEPEELSGITARLSEDGEGLLEYEGLSLSLGRALTEGPGPLQSLPILLTALREGYVLRAWRERDGETELLAAELWAGDDLSLTVWYDAQSLNPVHAGFGMDGKERIRCEITEFTAQ